MPGVTIDPDARTVSATRSLRASGTSLRLTIPPPVLDAIRAGEGDQMELIAHMDTGVLEVLKTETEADAGTEAIED